MGGKSAKLTEEEVSDLEANQNIRFDKKEIRELWNGWKYDLEQHGVELRPGELPGLPKKAFIKNFGQFAEYLFDYLNTDNDGIVSFQEFLEAISITCRGSLEEKLNWTFRLYDKDDSGSISRKEMGDIVSAIYSMVKFVECENEKNELIKIEVDTIFSSFNIGPHEELKRSVYLEEGFKAYYFT